MKKLLLLSLIYFFVLAPVLSQKKRSKSKQKTYVGQTPGARPNKKDNFLNTQWWMGMRIGTTLTEAVSTASYSVLSPIDYPDEFNNKVYDQYNNPGLTAGLEFVFFIKGFNIGFAPNYRQHVFTYRSNALWSNPENATQKTEVNYEHVVDMEYIDLPLSIKYEFEVKDFRPFVMVGGYYSTLMDATKEYTISGVDQSTGGQVPIQSETHTIGATDLFIKSSLGIMAGVGTFYNAGNVRIQFEASYRLGMHNITNANNRYTDNRLAGLGDAMDDLKMNSININLGILLPLKFLSKNYRATE